MRSKSFWGCTALFILCISMSLSYSQESLFPQIPGWKITQDDPVYNANNLWDIIDGAADLYLEYAFVDLHIARYFSTDSIEVKAELYRHASDVDAFGMYSQERDTGYNFIQVGVQGYLQQGVLNFLTGSYYIKLSTYQTGNKAQEAMQTIGKMLAEHLKQNNAMPKLFQVLPSKGKRSNTEQYIARNFLGYSFLNSAYVSSYADSSTFKVFIIESPVPEKASAMLAGYLNAVPKETVTKLGPVKYLIRDPNNGVIGLQVFDRYVYGIINCTDYQTQDQYLKEVTASLLR
jgi:RNAse (barnase) inhibitor barstar